MTHNPTHPLNINSNSPSKEPKDKDKEKEKKIVASKPSKQQPRNTNYYIHHSTTHYSTLSPNQLHDKREYYIPAHKQHYEGRYKQISRSKERANSRHRSREKKRRGSKERKGSIQKRSRSRSSGRGRDRERDYRRHKERRHERSGSQSRGRDKYKKYESSDRYHDGKRRDKSEGTRKDKDKDRRIQTQREKEKEKEKVGGDHKRYAYKEDKWQSRKKQERREKEKEQQQKRQDEKVEKQQHKPKTKDEERHKDKGKLNQEQNITFIEKQKGIPQVLLQQNLNQKGHQIPQSLVTNHTPMVVQPPHLSIPILPPPAQSLQLQPPLLPFPFLRPQPILSNHPQPDTMPFPLSFTQSSSIIIPTPIYPSPNASNATTSLTINSSLPSTNIVRSNPHCSFLTVIPPPPESQEKRIRDGEEERLLLMKEMEEDQKKQEQEMKEEEESQSDPVFPGTQPQLLTINFPFLQPRAPPVTEFDHLIQKALSLCHPPPPRLNYICLEAFRRFDNPQFQLQLLSPTWTTHLTTPQPTSPVLLSSLINALKILRTPQPKQCNEDDEEIDLIKGPQRVYVPLGECGMEEVEIKRKEILGIRRGLEEIERRGQMVEVEEWRNRERRRVLEEDEMGEREEETNKVEQQEQEKQQQQQQQYQSKSY